METIGIEPITQCLQSIVAPLVHVPPELSCGVKLAYSPRIMRRFALRDKAGNLDLISRADPIARLVLVESVGLEPTTYCLQNSCSPN